MILKVRVRVRVRVRIADPFDSPVRDTCRVQGLGLGGEILKGQVRF